MHPMILWQIHNKMQGKQLKAYKIVYDHYKDEKKSPPLNMIIAGTAGTGNSYLIKCSKKLLGDHLHVCAPTGVAAYNVHGHMLHSLLSIPIGGDVKDLEGQHLHSL